MKRCLIINGLPGVPVTAQWKWIWLGKMRSQVRSLASLSGLGSGIAVSCGIGCRRGSDLALLRLWHRPAVTAPIRPLAWEPPYAAGAALTRQKTKKRKEKKRKENYKTLMNKIKEELNKRKNISCSWVGNSLLSRCQFFPTWFIKSV